MAGRGWVAVILAASVLGGCGGGRALNCDGAERYARAGSSPPVRIPADLTPPDESDSLRVPPEAGAASRAETQRCLESPPEFASPSNRPAAPPGAPPASEPAPNPDREIGN